jgi:hypothetical protein
MAMIQDRFPSVVHALRDLLTNAMLAKIGTCAVVLLLLPGCARKDIGEPVEECRQYEALQASCFHRDTGFASNQALIPTSTEDRERIRQICKTNLQRLQAACR